MTTPPEQSKMPDEIWVRYSSEGHRVWDAAEFLPISTKYTRTALQTAAAQGEKVPDGMMLIRKSSMLEPDFERMVRQILDQAKQIKRLVRALENIASCNGDDVTGCAINALAEFEREGGK